MSTRGILLLVGTAKGLFILKRGGNGKWSIDGPHFAGRAVYAAFLDQRKKRNEMWAAPTSWHFGAELVKSTDMGVTWDAPERMRIKMPANTKKSLENIWQITGGANSDTLYVGAAPGALFESHDRGATWQLNKAVNDALRSLWNKHIALRDRVLTEQGEIRQHVNIFVGGDDVKRLQGLNTSIKSNEIHISNAVSGG